MKINLLTYKQYVFYYFKCWQLTMNGYLKCALSRQTIRWLHSCILNSINAPRELVRTELIVLSYHDVIASRIVKGWFMPGLNACFI